MSPLDSASAEQLDPANAGPLGPVGAGRWALQTRIAGLCRCGAAEPGRHRAGGLGRRGAVGPGRRGTLGPVGEGPLGRWWCEAAERKICVSQYTNKLLENNIIRSTHTESVKVLALSCKLT